MNKNQKSGANKQDSIALDCLRVVFSHCDNISVGVRIIFVFLAVIGAFVDIVLFAKKTICRFAKKEIEVVGN